MTKTKRRKNNIIKKICRQETPSKHKFFKAVACNLQLHSTFMSISNSCILFSDAEDKSETESEGSQQTGKDFEMIEKDEDDH